MASNSPSDSPLQQLEKPRSRNLTPSPRIAHFHGELTPVLSPLDAFALQGRLLAKQLDESKKSGRRMSRLPPASVARSLSQPRPGYYRAHSSGESSNTTPVSPEGRSHGRNGEVEEPAVRPKSQHPMLSRLPGQNLASDPDSDHERNTTAAAPDVPPIPASAFGDPPRAESPEDASWFHSDGETEQELPTKPSPDPYDIPSATRTREAAESSAAKRNVSNNLAPPSSSAKRSAGSPGLPQHESSDDDYFTSSTAGSTYSKPRKLSSSSGMSMPQSPVTHFTRPHPQSPSSASENSPIPNPLQRPSFNFSRPLSRSSTTISMPSPSLSGHEQLDEYQSRTMNRGNRPSPITVPKLSDSPADDAQTSAPTTYIYAKYALPRGRSLSRNSLVFTGLQTPHFEWNEPLFESSPPPSAAGRETFEQTPPSPSATHAHPPATEAPPKQESPLKPKTPTESERKLKSTASLKHEYAPRKPGKLVKRPDRTPPKRHSFDQGTRKTLALAKSNSSSRLSIAPKSEAQDDTLTISTDSNATLRPHTSRSVGPPPATTLSAEDHVAKGIKCHENGSLNESTYHLRIAAMQNEPTGMLLYALACRHGWGMRPNQREGVQWLRKAADSAILEANSSEPHGRNIQEDKARQAQFALSIYELGVSHLNGWGIEQDKALALRCFEIAGHWGDVDALAEAGFCYVEGLGCKKDLKKAAKYYRMAESKGMSMVGNSWIYKPKYMSGDDTMLPTPSLNSAAPGQDKKPLPTKSRTRSIFGRKKSTAATNVHNDS
ncbi:cell cycle inhibitor Nif1 [Blastomyces dermatitidis ER-3]|uniref:Cell cycle inhibitor Nif1 n=1 Tax=Ajellomyces dermatitidis (strain ER-3 / ATCC MYA-2586) TaxID=559297 RepID=A0ABP2ERW2_AJEDR|nr:cell cycle inhibitor Nif1 [Blastomyces dermatitidis ER-3]EEQ86447.2 cell cycle inhibitor Nif1 [Blastomyces dermatitidis ER-3]